MVAEPGELDQVAGIDAGRGAAEAGAHGEEVEAAVLALEVAPPADLMAAQEMAGLVRDHAGQLRLVAHPRQQAGKDDDEAGRGHEGVELGNLGEIDAQILRRRSADPLDQSAEIGIERRVAEQQVGAGNLLLDPSYCCHMPRSSLSVGR